MKKSMLSGLGQAWMDDLQIEVVGADVPTTGETSIERFPPPPRTWTSE